MRLTALMHTARFSVRRFDSLTFKLLSSPRGPSWCLLWTLLERKIKREQGGPAAMRPQGNLAQAADIEMVKGLNTFEKIDKG